MSRTRHRLAARTLAVLLTPGALVLPATAHAERWSGTDARHDARSLDPDATDCASLDPRPAPRNRTADLTRITVDHAADAVRLTAHLRDVRVRGGSEVAMFVQTPAHFYIVPVNRFTGSRWPHQYTSASVARVPRRLFADPCAHRGGNSTGGSSGTSTGGSTASGRRAAPRCENLPARYRPGKNLVTATVPRRCLGTPRWIRIGAYAVDMVGKRFVLDTWAPEGVADKSLIGGVLGPRVRAGSAPLAGGAQ